MTNHYKALTILSYNLSRSFQDHLHVYTLQALAWMQLDSFYYNVIQVFLWYSFTRLSRRSGLNAKTSQTST